MRTLHMAGAAMAALALQTKSAPGLQFKSGPDGTKTAEQLAAEIKADHARAVDAVRAIAESALGKAQAGEALSKSTKEQADEALLKMNELQASLDALGQKMARGEFGGATDEPQKSLGEQVVSDEGFKAWVAGNPTSGRTSVQTKTTITLATTAASGSVGNVNYSTRLPGLLELPRRRLTVRDLLAPGRMDGNALEYPREVEFRNNAAPVAEAALKPESDLRLESVTTSAKVIAHWMKASRQALDDISYLRSTIDERLRYGLALAEENQLLNGDGTGQNLSGLIPNATAFVAPFTVAGATVIDNLRLALLQSSLALLPADGIVMNEIDWGRVEMLKDADGRYIIGNPQGTLGASLWNKPVVATPAIAVDKFLVGAFRTAAQIFDRWDARVEVGFVNDDFIRNLVTILGEERLALAIYRPAAFVYGDFGYVT